MSLIFIRPRSRGIQEDIWSSEELWEVVRYVAVKLPEIILGKAIL